MDFRIQPIRIGLMVSGVGGCQHADPAPSNPSAQDSFQKVSTEPIAKESKVAEAREKLRQTFDRVRRSVLKPLLKTQKEADLLIELRQAQQKVSQDPENILSHIEKGQIHLAYLEIVTQIGSDKKKRKMMLTEGRKLQAESEQIQAIIAKKIEEHSGEKMQFLTGGESFENLCPVEQWNLCNLYWKPGRDYLLMSLYLKLRGIGFEGEAKNYLGLNPFRIIESVDALIRLDITGRFNRLAQYLVTVDPFDFEDAIFAHSIQVQSMVAWGRFYYRLPGLLKDLNKSKQWLERSILESLTNPTNLPIANDPILSRLFLVDTLKAEGEKKNHEKIRNLLQEVEDLENIGFSPWEVYLGDILQGLIRNFRKEFPITKSDP